MKILFNGIIHTLDDSTPKATALAIDDHAPHAGRVLAAGTNEEILEGYGTRSEKIDLGGAVVLPGLTDSHLHIYHYAHNLNKIDLFNCTKDECIARVKQRVKATLPGEWILGHGWTQAEWAGDFPNAADLDPVTPNNPVLLTAASLHSSWANTAAFKAAKINASTPDPENGRFNRLPDGTPDGMLFETATNLIQDTIPKPTPKDNLSAIEHAQQSLWQLGLTCVHDFDRIESFITLQDLHRAGQLSLRVLKNLPVENLTHYTEIGLRSGFGDDILRIGGLKLFGDGALGQRTAAMFSPYENEPDNLGMLFIDAEELFELASRASQAGLSMTIHAIGDKTNHEMLNGLEQLRKFERENRLPFLRHRIEHVQILHPDDLPRFAALDIIASMQPIHATADMIMADNYWGERSSFSYAWRSLLEQNTILAFGSDAPVDSPNPFRGLHAAVTRQRPDGSPGPKGWHPEQCLSIEAAINAYTQSPAFAAGMENKLGKLAPGFLADLIELDIDPFTCQPEELREIKPLRTMVGGDWVWES